MAELVALGREITGVLAVRGLDDGHALLDAQPIALEPHHLARIVRDRADRLQPEVEQDLRADAVVPEVRLEAQLLVGLDRVGAAILELVRLELVEEADAAPFLVEVDDDAATLPLDHRHRRVELPAAIAAHRVEDVTREALRVHAHEDPLPSRHIALDERDVLVAVDVVPEADDRPLSMLRRQT